MNIGVKDLINNWRIIKYHIIQIEDVSQFNQANLEFSFYITKELLSSPNSALNALINHTDYFLSRKVILANEIEEIINCLEFEKQFYVVQQIELDTHFLKLKKIVFGTTYIEKKDRTTLIIDNIDKIVNSRQALRYAIEYLKCIIKLIIDRQIRHIRYSTVESSPKFRYKKSQTPTGVNTRSFNSTQELTSSIIEEICNSLVNMQFLYKRQKLDFERVMLGKNVPEKIIWKKEISTLFYFIKCMHIKEYLIDLSAYKWKATATSFCLEDRHDIDFKKLRGLKKTKSCIQIDKLFNNITH